jgi:hypothetical protein
MKAEIEGEKGPGCVERIFSQAPKQLPNAPINNDARKPYLSKNQLHSE